MGALASAGAIIFGAIFPLAVLDNHGFAVPTIELQRTLVDVQGRESRG